MAGMATERHHTAMFGMDDGTQLLVKRAGSATTGEVEAAVLVSISTTMTCSLLAEAAVEAADAAEQMAVEEAAVAGQ